MKGALKDIYRSNLCNNLIYFNFYTVLEAAIVKIEQYAYGFGCVFMYKSIIYD